MVLIRCITTGIYLYLSITFQIADVKLAAVFIICEFVSLTPRKWFFILANTMQVRYGHLLVFSLLLTAAVVLNAFHQRKQFYPSMVYLSKSNASVTALYIQAFVLVSLVGKLFQMIFFGSLHRFEQEHIADRAMFAVTETCLAFTIFRDDFSPRFVAQFTQLFFFKCFHWMAEERIDYMERSPVITTLFCARVMGLIAILSAVDSYHISHAYFTTLQKGATPQIVFGFEYAILLTVVFHIAVKYVLHRVDLRQPHPWENKAVYLLYFELVIVFLRVLLYAIFICVTMQLHTFPLFSIRPMYLALKTLKKAIMDAILSQRAIRNMNSLYPDVTAEDLSRGDCVCIICREDITERAKKLPCNHIFHISCLRSWFQRQQTCPICRLNVLQLRQTERQQQQQQPQQQQQQQQAANIAGTSTTAAGTSTTAANQIPAPNFTNMNMPAWFAGLPAGIIPPPAPGVGDGTPSSINPTVFAGFTGNGNTSATLPMPIMPPFFPFTQAFPTPPDFTGLSDEEVRRMEGNERTAVEARIRCLRNIQTLLDGAVVLMQQYTSLMSAMDLKYSEKRTVNTEETEHKKETNSKTEEVNAKTVNIDELVEKPSTSAAAIAGTSSGDAQNELRQRRLQHYEKSTKAVHLCIYLYNNFCKYNQSSLCTGLNFFTTFAIFSLINKSPRSFGGTKAGFICILMTEMQLQVEHLVVDTVGFVKADDLRKYGKNIYTIQDVLNEIRDSNTRKKLSVLPYDLKTVIPDGKAIQFVTEFAKKTGDYPSLSVTDVKLIAAVYTMELEHVGSEHIIQEPKVQKTSSVGGQKCEEGKGLPGFYMPSKKKQSDCNDLEEAVRKIDIHDNSTSEEENSFSESDSEYEDEIRDTSNLSGWITPENFSSTVDSANDTVPVACLTADFAIQNVLLHMGLKVVSVDGMLIKQLKTYILRCFSCFHTTSKMMKKFCPNCGNATLKRLAISVDENGCTVFHFSRRKVISVRGSKFSIPAPKGGKHANNLILCEDQPVSQNRLSRKARQNLDVFDPDYIAGHSPFSLNDITSRSALLGIRAIHRPPRRNPNTYSLGRKRGGKKR
ncbi:E3 ubiquitin-protein ligase synoviolin B [Trichinella papuae]|uniref:E3 ubiquitin-protein ligase hrd-1 n=1 Tax=Trichinella papuae TaxID=268474 RepID=A0A0V1MYK6_9BILA|nr:E3 ubiquitin-protein ligase synoviolin B [Trichinella papuae]KRZ76831.1 E3 ubiquitin-protein ligase synoviolin B [Trichinella papuae]